MGEHSTWVVGLGSDHGDDRVGWEVIARLGDAAPGGVRAEATADPLALLDCPVGCGLLVVIDAGHGLGPPGSLHRIVWPDPRLVNVGSVSSHSVGVVAALELASALGRLPPRVVILAVEAAGGEPGAGLSAAVEGAIPAVAAAAVAECSGSCPARS